jgi:Cof subfamily protein (haloacid dehalogenase superfamily)
MTKTIKLIVVDLDGTLLDSKGELTERTEKTLKTAMEKGVQVILSTGKTRTSATQIIERLNLMTPGIFLQGLALYGGDGSLLHQQTLDISIARQIITFAEDRGFTVGAYSGNSILMRRQGSMYDDFFSKYREPMPEPVGPLQNILGEMPVNKLIVFGDPQRIKSLRWQLNMQHNGSIQLTQSHVTNMLEILPPGASKGSALKALVRELQIPAHEVLAIGDAENDIEMMQAAGIGVAMGNADEKTQAAADYVVATNDADGVAEAVERFVPGMKEEEAASADEAKPEATSNLEASTPPAATDENKTEGDVQ